MRLSHATIAVIMMAVAVAKVAAVEPEHADVKPVGGHLELTANLSHSSWPPNDNGKVTVDITTGPPEIKAETKEHYEIKSYQLKVIIRIPSGIKTKTTVVVTVKGVRDKDHASSRDFQGSVELLPPATTATASAPGGAAPLPKTVSTNSATSAKPPPLPAPISVTGIQTADDSKNYKVTLSATISGGPWKDKASGTVEFTAVPEALFPSQPVVFQFEEHQFTTSIRYRGPVCEATPVSLKLAQATATDGSTVAIPIAENMVLRTTNAELCPNQKPASDWPWRWMQVINRPPPPWLGYLNAALLFATLLLGIWYTLSKRLPPGWAWGYVRGRDPVQPEQPPEIKSVNAQELAALRTSIYDLSARIGRAQDDASKAILQISPITQTVQNTSARNENRFRQLEDRWDAFEGVTKQIGDLANLLEVLQQALATVDATSDAKSVDLTTGMAVAAIVNHWRGRKDRAGLLALARDIGIDARLASHRDLTEVFRTHLKFEYPFEERADGPWLWVPDTHSNEIWAAPADPAFFNSGDAASLLDRLFEGMKGAPPGFRFDTIYRACRLRPVADKSDYYQLAKEGQGCMQLVGATPPNYPQPTDYSVFLQQARASKPTPKSNLGRLMGDWATAMSKCLERLGQKQARLENAVRESPSRRADGGAAEEWKAELQSLQAELHGYQSQWQTEFAGVTAQLSKLAEAGARIGEAIASPPQANLPEPAVSLPTQPLGSQFPDVPVSLARKEQEMAAGVRGSPKAVSEPPPAPVSPAPLKPAETNGGPGAAPPEVQPLPAAWQSALRKSSQDSDSKPEVIEVPSPTLYVRRLQNLCKVLKSRRVGAAAVAIAHLKKLSSEPFFEIHEADVTSPETLLCKICNTTQEWQFVVSIGTKESGLVFVLMPLGMYSKGAFAAGYACLIEDVEGSSFMMAEIERPAELRTVSGRPEVFEVARKLIYFKPEES